MQTNATHDTISNQQAFSEAFSEACSNHGLNWKALQAELLQQGRYHVETY